MPGIDFKALRQQISIGDVLQLLAFEPGKRHGPRVRGACPLCCNASRTCFVVHLEIDRFHCFSCKQSGDQLDLWKMAHGIRIYEAAKDLCQRLNIEPPPIHRW